ncbi:MAG: ribokinase [Tissierellia bacterium]|jgi:ribokinase|nr:ribokinase [Tissierellia bacterium]
MGKIVVVGSINVDMVFTSDKRPKAGETVIGNTFSLIPGGKGANQAVAASKLGADTYMIGCVGNDSNGEFSLKNLRDMKVNTRAVKIVDKAPTGLANIIVADNDNSIIVIPGANFEMDKDVIKENKALLLSADMVLLQLEIPMEVVEYVVDICAENKVRVLINPAPAAPLKKSLIEKATYITPNEHELRLIFDNQETDAVLKQYPNKLIVTMGSRGVKYHDGNEIREVPSNKVDVVDTTGAGDTFCGALAAALVRGDSIEGAVIFANKAASFTVTRLGAQSGMPELADLL